MEWFCTEELRSALRSREKKLAAAFRILAAAAAIAFVVLCLLIRTDNAQTMHFLLIAIPAVFGWICIALRQFGIREVRAQLSHLDMLLEGQKDFREETEKVRSDGKRFVYHSGRRRRVR